jgi:hypothetical protein
MIVGNYHLFYLLFFFLYIYISVRFWNKQLKIVIYSEKVLIFIIVLQVKMKNQTI